MKKYKVGVIGGTGMVGQRFVTLMHNHPWFQLTVIAASPRSAGKRYEDAVAGRWAMDTPIPDEAKDIILMSAQDDVEKIAGMVDFVFSAVDMKKDEIQALEEAYAKCECPVVSNNSAHRWTPDVPMVIPEINPEHLAVIPAQRCILRLHKTVLHIEIQPVFREIMAAVLCLLAHHVQVTLEDHGLAVLVAGRAVLADDHVVRLILDDRKAPLPSEPDAVVADPFRVEGAPGNGAQLFKVAEHGLWFQMFKYMHFFLSFDMTVFSILLCHCPHKKASPIIE